MFTNLVKMWAVITIAGFLYLIGAVVLFFGWLKDKRTGTKYWERYIKEMDEFEQKLKELNDDR